MTSARARASVLVLGLGIAAASAAGPARADGGAGDGPAFGNNRFATTIATADGEADVDDYASPLVAGERLSVTVSAPKKSALRPVLSLVSPTGDVVEAPALVVKSKLGGRTVVLAGYEVPESGTWTVRIAGGATEGAYTARFKIAAPKALRTANVPVDPGTDYVGAFEGVAGARADLVLRWDRHRGPAVFRSIRGPDDAEVPGTAGPAVLDAKPRGGASLVLAGVVLPGPDGTYSVSVGADAESARVSLDVVVRPPLRPRSRRVLHLDDEPRLQPRATPVRAMGGLRVVLNGRNFSTKVPPQVTIGGVAVTSLAVGADGTTLDVLVPDGPDDTAVTVSVRNPDGQTSTRAGYLFYAPPPTVSDLVRADLSHAAGGSTLGGQTFHLTGGHLAVSGHLRFDGAAATILSGGATDLVIRTPAHAVGDAVVVYTDEFDRSATLPFTFRFKVPPVIDSLTPPYDAPAGGRTITVAGSGFESDDTFTLGGAEYPVEQVDASTLRFVAPAGAAGTVPFHVTDRVGTVASADFERKGPPTVSGVAVVAGPVLGTKGVPFAGGTTIRVTGTYLRAGDTVTLGGAAVAVVARTTASFDTTVPASTTPGDATLVVTDEFAQAASFPAAVRYVGFLDVSATRTPAPTAADSFQADAAAAGDLDGDGKQDDLVLASSAGSNVGSRAELTRILRGDGTTLADATAASVPAAGSDPAGADTWDANVLAIGDLDQGSGRDVVLGGAARVAGNYYTYDARLFTNGGSGAFQFDAAHSPLVGGESSYGFDPKTSKTVPFITFVASYQGVGEATCIAVGDIDADGDDDVVMGSGNYRTGYVHLSSSYVNYGSKTAPDTYTLAAGWAKSYSAVGTYYYFAGTRVFENDTKNGNRYRDRSFVALPNGGTFGAKLPALVARDLALGDLDGDGSLDLVMTWDDPTTTTAYGQYYGAGSDVPRIATEVLLNDGSGNFSDATPAWMPAGAGDEWWQGGKCLLVNLDPKSDTDLDLVVVDRTSVDAYTGSPTFAKRALRILRNDGPKKGFTDVTASSLPAVPLKGTGDDNLRGEALAAADFDGDGTPDLLVATTETLRAADGTPVRSTRLLLGGAGLKFTDATAFLPPATTDTGEAATLRVFDVAGRTAPTLFLVSPVRPGTSAGSRFVRCFEWYR